MRSEQVVVLLADAWRSIDGLCAGLSEDDWVRPTDCPGWSVQDQVAHLIGMERMLLGEQAPELVEAPHVKNPMGAVNEAWVAARRPWAPADVLREFREVTAHRLEALAAMPAGQFDEVVPSPIGAVPYREFMNVRIFDCWTHEQDIRRAVRKPGHLGGPVARLSVGRVTQAMPFVVGKKAAAPEGSTTVFDVSGEAGGIFRVEVAGGRGRLAAALEDRETVRISMDVETYCCLGCGRWEPQRCLTEGKVIVEGDLDLGLRVLDSMRFMI